MNAMAHDLTIDLSPDESQENALELSVREEAMLAVAIPVGIFVLVAAIVLELGRDALILLWFLFGMPLAHGARSTAHAAGVALAAARRAATRRRVVVAGKEEVALTYDELALISKSLQAAKTLGALPPQDFEDTIQVIDQRMTAFG
jgi:hypothetical protein